MPSGGVRDLLVELRLEQNQFKREMATARGEVSKLEAQFKAVKGDENVTDAGEMLKKNLEAQVKAMTEQVNGYEERLQKLKTALASAVPGSKDASGLTKDVQAMEKSLATAQTKLHKIKDELNNFRADRFLEAMEGITMAARDMEMAYGFLIGDWAKETADSADEINVSREQALAFVEKIAAGRDGWFEGWDQDIDMWIRNLITGIPIAYEEVSEAMANGMQAGGVAVDKIKDYTDVFVRMEKATDLTGEEGSRLFGKFLNVMETKADAYENVASTIVALGNSVAATESQIVETSVRSAAALRAVGMSEADILGVSAGSLMLGMEPAAAASSLEKLAIKAGGSAEFAAKGYEEFRQQLKAAGEEVTSFYDLQVAIDADGKVRKGLIEKLGMTGADFNRLMNNAVQAERVAGLMGQSVAEFAAAWEADPAKYFVSLFETIGKLDESGSESLFNILGELGITEIREGRLARNFAMVSESLMDTLELARLAEKEGTALDTETAKLFATTQSKRTMNENKSQNFLQKIGEGATAVRQTWSDVWADMQQTLTENLPEWAQTGIGATVEILSELGTVVSSVGQFAQGIYYTGQVYKDLRNIDWKNMKGTMGTVLKTGGKVLGGAAVVGGLFTLGELINQMGTDTTAISEQLANIQVNIDEESKKRTLSAIQEVKDAAQSLSDSQLDDRFAGTSAVVQRGFGTEAMFGQAVSYEQTKADRALEAVYADYGSQIADLEKQLLSAAGDADAKLIQQQIEQTEQAMNAQVQLVKEEYTKTLEALYAGAVKAHGSEYAQAQLMYYGQQHDALMKLYEAQKLAGNAQKEYMRNEGLYTTLAGWGIEVYRPGTTIKKKPEELIKDLYGRMAVTAEDIIEENGSLMTLMSTMLGEGALDNADIASMQGYLLRTMEALNLKQVGETGASNWEEIGRQYMGGLAMGVERGQGQAVAAMNKVMQALVSAARTALDIHSPSRVGYGLGVYWDEGIAGGILAGSRDINAAMRRTMQEMQAEADRMSPRINAVMAAAGSGGGFAGSGGGLRSGNSTSITNNYSVAGADIYTQQGVRRLAQQIARLQKKTNGSVGKG